MVIFLADCRLCGAEGEDHGEKCDARHPAGRQVPIPGDVASYRPWRPEALLYYHL